MLPDKITPFYLTFKLKLKIKRPLNKMVCTQKQFNSYVFISFPPTSPNPIYQTLKTQPIKIFPNLAQTNKTNPCS